MEYLRTDPKCLGKIIEPYRHDHKLLEVGRIAGVLAAVEDVEHGDWQAHFPPSRKIAPERYAFASILDGGAGFGHSHGNGENGIDAQVAFVRGAVKSY